MSSVNNLKINVGSTVEIFQRDHRFKRQNHYHIFTKKLPVTIEAVDHDRMQVLLILSVIPASCETPVNVETWIVSKDVTWDGIVFSTKSIKT